MREIKFRAWDKVANRFTKNLVLNHDGILKAKRFDGSLTQADRAERFNIQLFTGLKDKNGKEIYEGDIVKLQKERWRDDGFYNATVIWQENCSRFAFAIDYKNDDGVLYYGSTEVLGMEVIGNIYENPELFNSSQSNQEGKSDALDS